MKRARPPASVMLQVLRVSEVSHIHTPQQLLRGVFHRCWGWFTALLLAGWVMLHPIVHGVCHLLGIPCPL